MFENNFYGENMNARFVLLLMLLTSLVLLPTGCKKVEEIEEVVAPDYARPLPEGALALVKITNPAEIPDFTLGLADTLNLQEAAMNSLDYLSKPSSQMFYPYGDITHEEVVASIESFVELLDSGKSPSEMNTIIREKFDVYTSVGWDYRGTVLFTGYYTPIFDASTTKTAKFRYPLYKRPADLVSDEKTGEILGRKLANGTTVKYPERAVIEKSGMLKGTELVWFSDPFEVYIAQVQGSARLRMPDGKLVTAGYGGNNGHEYVSIGKKLIEDGKVGKDGLSLQAMIDFFKKNPSLVDQYVNLNPRFVFFRFDEGMPRGSINEPVIARRTIATDKEIYPRAGLAFMVTSLPKEVGGQIQEMPYTGFAMDQDTGGAIRAAGRCDVYMGVGDKAGSLAGHTYQEGRLYYLFLKK
jgi:membrane-bound lytic murein transglycosylase A